MVEEAVIGFIVLEVLEDIKLVSENIRLVSENVQNTDALGLSGNENELNRNRNVLTSQNTGNKRPSVVIHKYPERQTNFRGLVLFLVLYYLVELLYCQKVKETF